MSDVVLSPLAAWIFATVVLYFVAIARSVSPLRTVYVALNDGPGVADGATEGLTDGVGLGVGAWLGTTEITDGRADGSAAGAAPADRRASATTAKATIISPTRAA